VRNPYVAKEKNVKSIQAPAVIHNVIKTWEGMFLEIAEKHTLNPSQGHVFKLI
jgi:hypothetical protein